MPRLTIVLRWIGFIPAAFLAYGVAQAGLGFIVNAALPAFVAKFLSIYYVGRFLGALVGPLALIIVGTAIVPSHRFAAACALTFLHASTCVYWSYTILSLPGATLSGSYVMRNTNGRAVAGSDEPVYGLLASSALEVAVAVFLTYRVYRSSRDRLSGRSMSQVVGYQPGEWSTIASDDGREVMISIGRSSLWIFVMRGRVTRALLRLVPTLRRKYPQLVAKRTLLWVAPVKRADGIAALFRQDNGKPSEFGITLLEVVTNCLQEHADLKGTRFSAVDSPEELQVVLELVKNAEWCPQSDKHGHTPLSERDLEARLAFRKAILRLHPNATPGQLFEASAFFGVYNPALASDSFREIIQSLSASDPFCRELEMQLKGPLPSWLCFPPRFWKELESFAPSERDRKFKERTREVGFDLGEVFG